MDSETTHRSGVRTAARVLAVAALAATSLAIPGAHFAQADSGANSVFYVHPDSHFRQISALANPKFQPTPSYCLANFGLSCMTPSLIRAAYDVPNSSTLTGAGQTIVIVDAFGSPAIQQDVAVFDHYFHLPSIKLNVLYPQGPVNFNYNDNNQVGWAFESTLDVEYAHAIAPGATIDLVVSKDNNDQNLNVAQSYAIARHLGNVMSESFGEPENGIGAGADNTSVRAAHTNYQAATAIGMTVLVASGDGGANDGRSTDGTHVVGQFPADDPFVTAVGGTDVYTNDSGVRQQEVVWNSSDPTSCAYIGCASGLGEGATGGSPSSFFAAPAYQQGITHFSTRSTSDVSWNGGSTTPVLVVFGPYIYFVWGTSESAPSFAGAVALANQAAGHGLGNINPFMYSHMTYTGAHPIFHDITVGQNGDFEFNGNPGPGYSAGPGWDAPTGVGTPDVRNFVNAIAGSNY